MTNQLDHQLLYDTPPRRQVLSSLQLLAEQCRRGFAGGRAVKLPASYRQVREVVVCGMGGSTLGTDVIRSVYQKNLKLPFRIHNSYGLPGSVNASSLVVLVSYSGSTAEVLDAAKEALARGAKVCGITKGGSLAEFFSRHRLPWYQIDGDSNPANQPRLGLGYTMLGQLGLLSGLGLITVTKSEVNVLADLIEQRSTRYLPTVPTSRNQAKQIARALHQKTILLVGSDHLVGSMHALANQLNETAKAFAVWFPLPELNHHLLEGLKFPAAIRQGAFVFADASLTPPQLKTRENITRQLVSQLGLATVQVAVAGSTRLQQAGDLLTTAGYVSFYLSVLNRVDPMAIPMVDELKRRLSRP